MNKQVQFEFEDLDGQNHEVNIYVDGSPIVSLIDGKAGGDGYEIEHRPQEENQFNRVWMSEFSMVWQAENPSHLAVYNDIVTSNREYWVEVKIDGTIKWKGEIVKDFGAVSNTPFPRALTIQAKDGISNMMQQSAEVLVDESQTLPLYPVTVAQVFCNAFKTIQKDGIQDSNMIARFDWTDDRLRHNGYDPNNNYFGALLAVHPIALKNGEETREVIEDRFVRLMAGRDDDNNILTGSDIVNSRVFIQTEKIRDTFYTVADVLQGYLERLDLILFYEDNNFFVLQRDSMRAADMVAWSFKLDYTPNTTAPLFGSDITPVDVPRTTNPFGRIRYESVFNNYPKANQISHTLVPTINPELNRIERVDDNGFLPFENGSDVFYRVFGAAREANFYTLIENITEDFGDFAVVYRVFTEQFISDQIIIPVPINFSLASYVRFNNGTDTWYYDAINENWVQTTNAFPSERSPLSFQTNSTRIREFRVPPVPSSTAGDVEIKIVIRWRSNSAFFRRYGTTNPIFWQNSPPTQNGFLSETELGGLARGYVKGVAKAILPNGNQTNIIRTFTLTNQTRTGVNYSRGNLPYDNNGNYLPQYRIGRIRPGESDPPSDIFSFDSSWGIDGADEELSLNDLAQREMAQAVYIPQEGLEADIKQRIPLWHRVTYSGKIYRWSRRTYVARHNESRGNLMQILPRTTVPGTTPSVPADPVLTNPGSQFGSPGQIQGDLGATLTVATLGVTLEPGEKTSFVAGSLQANLKGGQDVRLVSPSGSFLAKIRVASAATQGEDVEVSTSAFDLDETAPEGSLIIVTMADILNQL